MVLKIYFIRNGETEANKASRTTVGGRSNDDANLTDEGVSQAKALANRFHEENIEFDSIYISPAIRAQQTANYCIEAMNSNPPVVELKPALLELSQGDWEGLQKEDVYKRRSVIENLKKDCWNFTPGNKIKGESQRMVSERIKKFVDKLVQKHPNGRIALFTHAYPIKFFLANIFDLDKTTAYKIPVNETSITVLRYENEEFKLVKQNDYSHLEN
jgi:broad specificity phosphatase PhoE